MINVTYFLIESVVFLIKLQTVFQLWEIKTGGPGDGRRSPTRSCGIHHVSVKGTILFSTITLALFGRIFIFFLPPETGINTLQ